VNHKERFEHVMIDLFLELYFKVMGELLNNLLALSILIRVMDSFSHVVAHNIKILHLHIPAPQHIPDRLNFLNNFEALVDAFLESLEKGIDEITPEKDIWCKENGDIQYFIYVFGSYVAVSNCRCANKRPVN
jgi:hypothetical protein